MFGSRSSPQATPMTTKNWELTHYNGNIYDPKPDDEVAKSLEKKEIDSTREIRTQLSSGVTSHTAGNTTQHGLTINT